MPLSTQLSNVIAAIDEKNALDPNLEDVNGIATAKELIYGQRMSECLDEFSPQASEHLQIACRAQHIQRWTIPRKDYPMDRTGYKRWRTELAKFHAQLAAKIMTDNGYSSEDCDRVQHLLQKKQLKRDAETQTLEDVACLVFLRFHLDDFACRHQEQKVIDIIQKTWNKMSGRGHDAALKLSFSDAMGELVGKALNG